MTFPIFDIEKSSVEFISIVCDMSRLSSGLFHLYPFFYKIPSSHVGNFRKAVVFIVESGI